MTVIVFPDLATADAVCAEIASTPVIEGGLEEPVWLWFDPDTPGNIIAYAAAADGRRAVAHPWSEVERDWLEAYIAPGWPTVQILDELPADWVWPDPEP